jgi:hypothetical protein
MENSDLKRKTQKELNRLTNQFLRVIETAKKERVQAIKFYKAHGQGPAETKKHVRLRAKIKEVQEENKRLRQENDYLRRQISMEERKTLDPKEVKYYSELSNKSAQSILQKIKRP